MHLPGISLTCYKGWHTHSPATNTQWISEPWEEERRAELQEKQMVFASMTDARLLPTIPAQTEGDARK